MRTLALIIALLGFACLVQVQGANDLSRYEVWIDGDVFVTNDTLMFRASKAVQGNTTGNVVLLGASKDAVKVLLPFYARAAEKHMKLRLYGVLLPASGKPVKGTPSVEFITWKVHLPGDPDELAADKKIIIHKDDTVEGMPVHVPSK